MKKKLLTILSVLFGLLMMNAGLDKFLHYMPVPDDLPAPLVKAFTAFTEIGWLLPLVGTVELLGGLLFVFSRTRALGALMLLPVFAGITLVNTLTDNSGLPIVLVLLAILFWVMYENKHKYLYLLGRKHQEPEAPH